MCEWLKDFYRRARADAGKARKSMTIWFNGVIGADASSTVVKRRCTEPGPFAPGQCG